ncbi:MAG TPA: hypothetical protein VGM87_05960 [Roseomonas sp.]|jgi:hypothetical protein
MTRAAVLALLIPLGLGACAVIPPDGPQVLSTPPGGKTLAQFQAEDSNCRTYASAQIGYGAPGQAANQAVVGSTPPVLQQRYDAAYAQCMTSAGNALQMPPAVVHVYDGPYAYPYAYPYYPFFYGSYASFGFRRGFYGYRSGYGHRGGGRRG